MRATDIIRGVLDLIDQIDCDPKEPVAAVLPNPEIQTGVDTNRFDQIIDLLTADYHQMYDNSPAEVVAGIDSVTTKAGGGWNGPKNPADLRSNSLSLFPGYQAESKGQE
jgi:hypothetical protein